MAFMVPDAVATHFHVRFGERVADFGAGSGHFVKALSRLVGPNGKIYAIEIQRQLAEGISDMARKEKLSNVESIWGDIEHVGGTKLPDSTLDAVVLSNTLSMVEDKRSTLEEVRRVLRKGGKLIIVDWTDSSGGLGPQATMLVTDADAKELGESAGFVFERTFPAGDHHYGISLRKGS